MFKRVNDNKKFAIAEVLLFDQRKTRAISEDGELDDLTWVSNTFYVSGSTGHTYIPVQQTSVSA